MDLLDEYKDLMLDDFIEGRLRGSEVWIKSTEGGAMTMYSPNVFPGRDNSATMMRIEIPNMGKAIELAGTLIHKGKNLYTIQLMQVREVEL